MKRNKQSGFTLIEVIAAFALMAIALTLCLAVASRAYRQQAQSEHLALAVQWARSLADDPSAPPLAPGVTRGKTEDGRFQWTRTVTAFDVPTVLTVRWTLHWQEDARTRSYETVTLRRAVPNTRVNAHP